MKQTTNATFDQTVYNPVLFTSYKIAKKLIKYSFYIALIYFAYEGFMAWD
ncbi:hypothetical protein QNI16_38355 [Cytophagaceae bacterium YF14B1]|uniref:Uncharacterized protein n=1 Tax=Xanthocytophaga flava TaxID=3048013 RepID=A0AAE3UAQ3_9BACT|nr:hypothetical protein [Xanthocytophaga flavus]MDJ1486404.1 hypothetical protein [Xanthocytophaga flavus]